MIELRHIRVFLALAEELHFGRTALRLHVAQSAISQTIRQLEDELGASVFTRTRRDVRLSRAGEAFRSHAHAVLRELDRGAEAARTTIDGETGRLVIRCVLTAALSGLPELIAQYRARYPRVVIDLAAAGTTTQIEFVRTGRCDLAIVPFQPSIAPLAIREIARGKLCAFVPRGHRFATRRSIALAALANEDLVFLRREVEPQTHRAFVGRCREAGFEPRIAVEVDQLEMMLGSVAAGLGIACISSFVSHLGFPGIIAVPLTPTVATKICAVWDPQQLAPAAQNFLDLVDARVIRRASAP
jgi:DNA-binding transcriptional LysR family regulator